MSDQNLDQILSQSFRPQTFSQLVGQARMAKLIREHYKSGRSVPAWMFVGQTGVGKTTIARIIALSLQCPHQTEFGEPCADCQSKRGEFDIVEINASDISGVNEIQQVISGSNFYPRRPSRKRVYILDEAQKLSDSAQNSLLKPFEDSPKTTVWIICTTEPRKILATLRSRCLTYTIPGLGMKGVEALVRSSMKSVNSDGKSPDALIDALHEQNVTSPRLVVMAVEKYLAGQEAEQAAQVGLEAAVNTLRICRGVTQGDWNAVRAELKGATVDDARSIRGAVAGYLKAMLVGKEIGADAAKCAEAIVVLSDRADDMTMLPSTCAVLYRVCRSFRRS